jgi:type I restriction-modification system DNA methylase subunit
MALDLSAVETRLWAAADQLWANTGLRPADFSEPVLGLIFLRYADKLFEEVRRRLVKKVLRTEPQAEEERPGGGTLARMPQPPEKSGGTENPAAPSEPTASAGSS